MLSEAEMRMIGASDMPALFGLGWGGPFALWARIVHGWAPEYTSSMAAGHAFEDANRQLYRHATGYQLLGPQSWRHPVHQWLRCSPDDVAEAPEGRRLVELKRYNRLSGWGAAGSDQVPLDVWVQVQVQAGVGLDNGLVEGEAVDVSALLAGEHVLYHVPHVPEVYERAMAMAERFWVDHVERRAPPEGAGLVLLERDAQAVAALYPAPTQAEAVEWASLPEEARAVLADWAKANKARRAWEEQEEALDTRLRLLLRDVPQVVGLPEEVGRRVDFKPHAPRARLDERGLRAAVVGLPNRYRRKLLKLLDKHTRRDGMRPLRLY